MGDNNLPQVKETWIMGSPDPVYVRAGRHPEFNSMGKHAKPIPQADQWYYMEYVDSTENKSKFYIAFSIPGVPGCVGAWGRIPEATGLDGDGSYTVSPQVKYYPDKNVFELHSDKKFSNKDAYEDISDTVDGLGKNSWIRQVNRVALEEKVDNAIRAKDPDDDGLPPVPEPVMPQGFTMGAIKRRDWVG